MVKCDATFQRRRILTRVIRSLLPALLPLLYSKADVKKAKFSMRRNLTFLRDLSLSSQDSKILLGPNSAENGLLYNHAQAFGEHRNKPSIFPLNTFPKSEKSLLTTQVQATGIHFPTVPLVLTLGLLQFYSQRNSHCDLFKA